MYVLTVIFMQVAKRLMLTLSLLKKEYELSKLQQRIGREVDILNFSFLSQSTDRRTHIN